ncbi:hypothetical protein JXA70_10175 [candidate division KSB1 bacterium]|nr:hypothetical protein [candidate division KSB1 bacterium]
MKIDVKTTRPITFFILIMILASVPKAENKDHICRGSFTLSDPVRVYIRFKDDIDNPNNQSVTVRTRYAVPPSSPDLFNQNVRDVFYVPSQFIYKTDNWQMPVAEYERAIPARSASDTYYDVRATIYHIQYDLDPSKVRGPIPADIYSDYTKDASKYDITNPVIQNAVMLAVGGETNLYHKAKKLHDYIIQHLYYEIDGRHDPAPVVLTRGSGSCSEYTFIFIALCRAAGIPARYIGGTVTPKAGFADDVYHRWVQIYLPYYGWIPVDVTWDDKGTTPSYTYFGATSNKLFVTTIRGDSSSLLKWGYNFYDSVKNPAPQSLVFDREAQWLWRETCPPKDIICDLPTELDNMKTGDPAVNNWIDEIMHNIVHCMQDQYWFDENHLYPATGKNVFQNAAGAAVKMRALCSLTDLTFHATLEKLACAGQMLSETSLEEAENTPVQLPANQPVVDDLLSRANEQMSMAQQKRQEQHYELAIFHYKNAWQFACAAIDCATSGNILAKNIGADELQTPVPTQFCLLPNYPNPFNPSTHISYQLAEPSFVLLKVYNLTGQEIRTLVDEAQEVGAHTVPWNGTDALGMEVPSGTYIYCMRALGDEKKEYFTMTQKMVLLR